ncbi:hypothetical protein SAMN05444166_5421 [Singulisphaera sp. GP187]|nr:hypothetical protein SAMN05444166_5421 [Singulisphaera sp. GP187]
MVECRHRRTAVSFHTDLFPPLRMLRENGSEPESDWSLECDQVFTQIATPDAPHSPVFGS